MSDQQDSCSMTPPLSPVFGPSEDMEEDFMDDDFPEDQIINFESEPVSDIQPCFCCCGEVTADTQINIHPSSYLKSGVLERLVYGTDPNYAGFQGPLCELLGFNASTHLALAEDTDKLFLFLRQQISMLEGLMTSTGHSANKAEYCMEIRNNIRVFIEYVKCYVCRYLHKEQPENFLEKLCHNLHVLLLHMGRLTELPGQVLEGGTSRQGNKCSTPAYHVLHCHLDLHWGVVEILHLVSVHFSEFQSRRPWCQSLVISDELGSDMFHQCIQMLLWDLVVMAINRHNQMSDSRQTSPFSCSCIRELWILIIHLLDYRNDNMGKNSFWITLDEILQFLIQENTLSQMSSLADIDSDVFMLPPEYTCANPSRFCWWFLRHLAPLYAVTMSGESSNKESRSDESYMRFSLKCCYTLSRLWEQNVQVLYVLWDHFFKRLNDPFQIPGLGLAGLTKICKTASSWVEKVKRRCENDSSLETDNSFQLFLRLLAVHLSSSDKTSGANPWKQMKGRFYCKFHQRRMQELTETGLYNFTDLFLTLAMVSGDIEDVSGKLFDLYALVESDPTRKAVIWNGVFALMLIHVERGLELGPLAEKVAQEFNTLCHEFSLKHMDTSNHHHLWSLVSLYLENTQDVIEESHHLQGSEYKLLGRGLCQLLPACKENELRSVLNCLQCVMNKLRSVCEQAGNTGGMQHIHNYREMADTLWTTSYQFIKDHSVTLTPPPQLADLTAGFTLMAVSFPARPGCINREGETFLSSFRYFALGASVNSSVSCRYLCRMLEESAVVEKLVRELPNCQGLLIQAWLKCALLVGREDEQIQQLTRLILTLPETVSVFTSAELDPTDQGQTAVIQFIKALGRNYSQVEGFMDKIAFRDKASVYFSDMTKHIGGVIKTFGPPAVLRNILKICGYVVKYCASFLYIQSKPDCLLPALLSKTVLPSSLFGTKPINSVLLAAIRDYLHLYVQGLGQLDYRRDQFIQRQLKNIVDQYLQRFPLKPTSFCKVGTVIQIHPLVTSLKPSFNKAAPDVSDSCLRAFVLDVVRERYLINNPHRESQGLAFIVEVLEKTQNPAQIVSDAKILLSPLLEYSSFCDNPSARQLAITALTKHVLPALKQEVGNLSDVVPVVQAFFNKHIHLHHTKVLKTLEILALTCPRLIQAIAPIMTETVQNIERKRGVGKDGILRQSYNAVLKCLGDVGQQEMTKLR